MNSCKPVSNKVFEPNTMSDDDENHLIAERRAKLAKLREPGAGHPADGRPPSLSE